MLSNVQNVPCDAIDFKLKNLFLFHSKCVLINIINFTECVYPRLAASNAHSHFVPVNNGVFSFTSTSSDFSYFIAFNSLFSIDECLLLL